MRPQTLSIASAIIKDSRERLLLVRKRETPWFMQAGGKIDHGETAIQALCRELHEELGISVAADDLVPLGVFSAVAANEPATVIEAELFFLRLQLPVRAASEIAEAIWVTPKEARALPLAPLTRDHVLPLAEGDERAR